MVTQQDPVSAYLMRPLRSLRQTCVDSARRRGRVEPECGDCNLGPTCEAQDRAARKLRRGQGRRRAGSARREN